MTRRVALRLGLLVAAALGLLIGLTAYFSSEKLPPCLVSGAPKWRAPTDRATHRFLVVVPDRALCFYDIDEGHKLVGAVQLRGIAGIAAIGAHGTRLAVRYGNGRGALVDLATGRHVRSSPPPPPTLLVAVRDPSSGVVFSTRPGELGFRADGRLVRFEGFAWNPKFGPNPPNHGLALFPRRRELWVLDAPNSVAHVYEIGSVARQPPRHLDDIRFSKPISGDENPCAHARCGRLGSFVAGAGGRYLYVGDAGDVVDVAKREVLLNLEALHQSRLALEVDWVDGSPTFPGSG
jgi:hypothetical protein